ncbi:hypothetical protein HK101_011308 [Irineochytrium annulatum]|nr:hypothetical protein HK101_011308 [Irineochytrium annulatum]
MSAKKKSSSRLPKVSTPPKPTPRAPATPPAPKPPVELTFKVGRVPSSDKSVTRYTHIRRVHVNPTDLVKLKLWLGEIVQLVDCRIKEGDPIVGVGTLWAAPTCPEGTTLLSGQLMTASNLEVDATIKIKKAKSGAKEAAKAVVRCREEADFSNDSVFGILIKEILVDIRYVHVGFVFEVLFNGRTRCLVVEKVGTYTDVFVAATEPVVETKWDVFEIKRASEVFALPVANPKPAKEHHFNKVGYSFIGGLSKELKEVQDLVEDRLKNPDRFSKHGLRPPRGMLLHGPPGTGKTLIARAVASETGAHLIVINGPDVISKFYGETEEKLRGIFREAEDNEPAIVFIDELDALCPKRDEATSDLEKRVVATLLTLMDGEDQKGIQRASRVAVLAATNRVDTIDEALRRPGRFDREVEIGIPDAPARLEILNALLSKIPHSLTPSDISDVAASTHGFVGADLSAICREAGLRTIARLTAEKENRFAPLEGLEKLDLRLTREDVIAARATVRPSSMREVLIEVPKVLWTDIGGQADIKQRLKEAVEWPLKHPEAFLRFNIRPPKGILLYGPPGCSKTLMAKALATEGGLNFLAVKGPELFSKWVGESEKAIQNLFKKARAASPSIVFFDEIDAIAVRRGADESSVQDRVLSQLLGEMDGIEPLVNVTVVAATNRPDILDSALLRPGRIDRILYVAPPDIDSRREILRIKMAKMTCAGDVSVDEFAKLTEGYSGAEVAALCQDAALSALEESIEAQEVQRKHFVKAIETTTPRISKEMIAFYDNFRKRSGLRSI